MVNAARTQRIYDHRLRNLVYSAGRIQIALDRRVPRSTARGWLRTSPREVVSIDELERSAAEIRKQVFALREKNSKLRAPTDSESNGHSQSAQNFVWWRELATKTI